MAEGNKAAGSGAAFPEYQTLDARSLGNIPKLDAAALAAMPKMISTDSHVVEPDDLWKRELPQRLSKNIPTVKIGLPLPGASDPKVRIDDQERDGIEAEVLFPNNGMALFGLDDVETQREGFRVFNDWLADYCKTSPKRLFGIPCKGGHSCSSLHRPAGQPRSVVCRNGRVGGSHITVVAAV